ncbi:hypothetical protein Nepgr_033830 [Nepenthes gracilis]|uniref:Uncharacterized protein n=1 Tax=Nepenthes gracilis TaxID=150966 RepID=A0AAD3TMN0_NEPGR|nr:hypothetical protein Nepgr_033830 [Nepenthes gracilis]
MVLGLLSGSPIPPPTHPISLYSEFDLNTRPPTPPSSILCAHERASIEPATDGMKSVKSVTAYCGDVGLSICQYCLEGLSPFSKVPPTERANKQDALDSVSGTEAPLEFTLVESELRSSVSLPVEPPLKLNDTVADSLCQSDAPAASPMGVSWASVVEKRTIGERPNGLKRISNWPACHFSRANATKPHRPRYQFGIQIQLGKLSMSRHGKEIGI